jgi:hypothetical protein
MGAEAREDSEIQMKGDGALCNYDLPLPPELGLPAEMTAAGPGARTQPIPRPLTSAHQVELQFMVPK